MLFTLAMASYQNVQILLRLALMLVCDLLVQLQKLWSRWETKLLHERRPLKQVQMFRCTVLQVQELYKYECDTEECGFVFSLHLASSVDMHSFLCLCLYNLCMALKYENDTQNIILCCLTMIGSLLGQCNLLGSDMVWGGRELSRCPRWHDVRGCNKYFKYKI